MVSANIPGSHIVTINDLVRLKKLATLAPSLYRVYRVVMLVVNPAFQIPTTAARFGTRLAVVNAKFDTEFPPTATSFEVVVVDGR